MLVIELGKDIPIGIIVPFDSGIKFSNQTGGMACLYPELEGIYIPLRSWEEDLQDPFCLRNNVWNAKYDKEIVELFLKEFSLEEILEPMSPPKGERNMKAWVWARIKKDTGKTYSTDWTLKTLAGMPCVITYPNSY